jgi:hypothetical protein
MSVPIGEKISIARFDLQTGETKAQSCDMA